MFKLICTTNRVKFTELAKDLQLACNKLEELKSDREILSITIQELQYGKKPVVIRKIRR